MALPTGNTMALFLPVLPDPLQMLTKARHLPLCSPGSIFQKQLQKVMKTSWFNPPLNRPGGLRYRSRNGSSYFINTRCSWLYSRNDYRLWGLSWLFRSTFWCCTCLGHHPGADHKQYRIDLSSFGLTGMRCSHDYSHCRHRFNSCVEGMVCSWARQQLHGVQYSANRLSIHFSLVILA
jgi:hypothetical protein